MKYIFSLLLLCSVIYGISCTRPMFVLQHSTVHITVSFTENTTGRTYIQRGGGVLLKDGIVVSAKHIFFRKNTTRKTITVKTKTGKTVPGSLLWTAKKNVDLAEVKIDLNVKDATVAAITTRPLEAGEMLRVIGHPYGYIWSTATVFVSHPERSLGNTPHPYIQTNGHINPGNSGGPAFSKKGKLTGIAKAYIPQTGIGFIIPISYYCELRPMRCG